VDPACKVELMPPGHAVSTQRSFATHRLYPVVMKVVDT
jgi:hypothetical protein